MNLHPVHAGTEDRLVSSRLGFLRSAGAFWMQRAWRLWPAAWLWGGDRLAVHQRLQPLGHLRQPGPHGLGRSGPPCCRWPTSTGPTATWAPCSAAMSSTRRRSPPPCPPAGACWCTGRCRWKSSSTCWFRCCCWPARGAGLLAGLAVALLVQLPLARPPLGGAWFFRTDALLMGVALAWAAQAGFGQLQAVHLERWRWPLRLAALALVVALAWLGVAPRSGQAGTVTAIALVCAALVWIAGHDRSLLVVHGRLQPLLLWLGSRSYSLYLAHLVVFFATREIWFRWQGDLQHAPHPALPGHRRAAAAGHCRGHPPAGGATIAPARPGARPALAAAAAASGPDSAVARRPMPINRGRRNRRPRGVSITNTSPGAISAWPMWSSGSTRPSARSTRLMPKAPGCPPAMPKAPWWRPLDRIDAVIGSRKRTRRTPPSPPRWAPAPPDPARMA